MFPHFFNGLCSQIMGENLNAKMRENLKQTKSILSIFLEKALLHKIRTKSIEIFYPFVQTQKWGLPVKQIVSQKMFGRNSQIFIIFIYHISRRSSNQLIISNNHKFKLPNFIFRIKLYKLIFH